MGIPGCGKSSIIKSLQSIYNAQAFYEPEEDRWPDVVFQRSEYGYFSSISWFRSMRVPQLFQARKLADKGQLVFTDSYFDKLLHNYIGKPGLDWFLPVNDRYFNLVKEMALIDYTMLPNADLVLFFLISPEIWQSFLHNRNRNMDNEEQFKNECFALQEPMLKATEKYANDFKTSFLVIEQELSSPQNIAQKIVQRLNL